MILNPESGTMLDAFVRSVQYGRHPKHQEITRTDLVTWTMAHPLLALQALWTKELAYKDKFSSSWKHWGENAPWWVWPWWLWHHGPGKSIAAIAAVVATAVFLGTVL